MAEQRQPFRFRLPWSAAPSTPWIREKPQVPSETATQAEKRPFRPAGVAPTQSSPTAQTASRAAPMTKSSPGTSTPSQTSSQPGAKHQVVPPPRAPPASPSRTVPKHQVATKPDISERLGPQPQQVRKTLAKSPSPPPKATQIATLIDPTMKPSTSKAPPQLVQETKPISSPKKNPDTSEISNPRKKQVSQQSSEEPQVVENIAPQPEKVVEALETQTEQATPNERNLTVPNLSGAEPESKQRSTEENYGAASEEPADKLDGAASEEPADKLDGAASEEPADILDGAASKEPAEILDGVNQELQKKAFTGIKAPGSKVELKGHPIKHLNEQDQHPREEAFDQKEILNTFGSNDGYTKGGNLVRERAKLFSHKHAMTRENVPSSKEIKEDLPKTSHKLGLRDKHEEIEKPFSIITLSGENTGATVHLSSEPWKREKAIHIHRGYKLNPEEKCDTDGEGSSRSRKSRETKSTEETGTTVYLNNNTQGINNSLVFSSSVTERNPGAHVVHSRKEAEPVKAREDKESLQTRRAEVSSIPAESLTYVPNIRRRCLRGLMMESSDSDPEKPLRHGCQVGWSQQSKDDLTDVL